MHIQPAGFYGSTDTLKKKLVRDGMFISVSVSQGQPREKKALGPSGKHARSIRGGFIASDQDGFSLSSKFSS